MGNVCDNWAIVAPSHASADGCVFPHSPFASVGPHLYPLVMFSSGTEHRLKLTGLLLCHVDITELEREKVN